MAGVASAAVMASWSLGECCMDVLTQSAEVWQLMHMAMRVRCAVWGGVGVCEGRGCVRVGGGCEGVGE